MSECVRGRKGGPPLEQDDQALLAATSGMLATSSHTRVANPVKMPCTANRNARYSCQLDNTSLHPWPSHGSVESAPTRPAAITVTVAAVAARWPASIKVLRK